MSHLNIIRAWKDSEYRKDLYNKVETLPTMVIARVLCVVLLLAQLCSIPSTEARGRANTQVAQDGQDSRWDGDGDDRFVASDRELAELQYKAGVRVVFSYDENSQEYGLQQQGRIDESAPIVREEGESLLAVFLAITPVEVPVPELLLAETPEGSAPPAELRRRTISASRVTARKLDWPVMTASLAVGPRCDELYFPQYDWHDPAEPGMAPTTYYSASFGGKRRYADSYIFNCTPRGSPTWLWARHRIYYRNAFGNYVKHYDFKVPPGSWDAKTKGSIKRYRAVYYTDGWDSHPRCGSLGGIMCKYTREGGFHD